MTWPSLVAEHTNHWLRFDGPDAVRCHPCDRRILLPLRPDIAPTPAPPPWKAERGPVATPEAVADATRRAREELERVRQKRTTKEEM